MIEVAPSRVLPRDAPPWILPACLSCAPPHFQNELNSFPRSAWECFPGRSASPGLRRAPGSKTAFRRGASERGTGNEATRWCVPRSGSLPACLSCGPRSFSENHSIHSDVLVSQYDSAEEPAVIVRRSLQQPFPSRSQRKQATTARAETNVASCTFVCGRPNEYNAIMKTERVAR
jgi:hypothetical protein